MKARRNLDAIARMGSGETVIVPGGYAAILESIQAQDHATYKSLTKETGIALATAYIYVRRLDAAGLVSRESGNIGGVMYARLTLAEGVVFTRVRKLFCRGGWA
jgi:hypothetical protein